MKRFNLTLGVCLLALFACLFAAAGVAQASILLVDRGLPTYGVYEGSSWGTNWSLQNNFAVGYFDPKDPANVPPMDVPGDDFTLPTGPTGPNPYQITDIRIWIQGSSTLTFSQEFNNISLLLGPIDGTLTNTNVTPTVTAVGFPNGQAPGTVLWQLDYAVNLTGTCRRAVLLRHPAQRQTGRRRRGRRRVILPGVPGIDRPASPDGL